MTREIKMEIRMHDENERRHFTTGYDRTTGELNNNSTNQGIIPYAVHKSQMCAFVFFLLWCDSI